MKATKQKFPVELFITLDKVVLTFQSMDKIHKEWPFKVKATKQYFSTLSFIVLILPIPTFKFPVDKILNLDRHHESYWVIFSFGPKCLLFSAFC